MFRGVSALESEVTESADFDAVSDEIRSDSNVSYSPCILLFSSILCVT